MQIATDGTAASISNKNYVAIESQGRALPR
jgi:hypothetical protein